MFSRKFWIAVIATVTATPAILYAYYHFPLINIETENVLSIIKGGSNVEIVLTEKGFTPSDISIDIGTTVRFSNETDEAFWPASNVHPEHTAYPTFDPKRPLSKDETWTFTFTESGRYGFHDHIFANYTGTIHVGDTVETVDTLDIHECAQWEEPSKKRACWDAQLERAMRIGGVEGAFTYFNELYKTEPDVPKECHGWSHTLGKAGYAYYKEHGNIELSTLASACGFGFYHSYLGELMKDTGDYMQAKLFCENAMLQLPEIAVSCTHGIGHGASSIFSENPVYYGQFQNTVDGAIGICEQIFSRNEDLTECYDGVYNEVYGNIFNSMYGYTYEDYKSVNDPFHQCHTQDEKYKESCYINVVGMFWELFNKDVIAGMTYVIHNLPSTQIYGPRIVARVAADRIQESIVADDHTDSIEACEVVPHFLYEDCFKGILNGFLQHGEPNNFHVKALAFCQELPKNHTYKGECKSIVANQMEYIYTKERIDSLCGTEALLTENTICKDRM